MPTIGFRRKTMMHGSLPTKVGQGCALSVRNGDDRHPTINIVERCQIWNIKASVEGGYVCIGLPRTDRKMQVVDMKVDEIKLIFFLEHLLELNHVAGNGIYGSGREPESFGAAGNQPGSGQGLSACEQRHFVTQADQFFGQPGNYALCPTISFRRNTLI